MRITFYDHHAAGLVRAVFVGGDTAVFARVFGLAVDNFQRDHTIRVRDCVIAFRQLFSSFEPLYL